MYSYIHPEKSTRTKFNCEAQGRFLHKTSSVLYWIIINSQDIFTTILEPLPQLLFLVNSILRIKRFVISVVSAKVYYITGMLVLE